MHLNRPPFELGDVYSEKEISNNNTYNTINNIPLSSTASSTKSISSKKNLSVKFLTGGHERKKIDILKPTGGINRFIKLLSPQTPIPAYQASSSPNISNQELSPSSSSKYHAIGTPPSIFSSNKSDNNDKVTFSHGDQTVQPRINLATRVVSSRDASAAGELVSYLVSS